MFNNIKSGAEENILSENEWGKFEKNVQSTIADQIKFKNYRQIVLTVDSRQKLYDMGIEHNIRKVLAANKITTFFIARIGLDDKDGLPSFMRRKEAYPEKAFGTTLFILIFQKLA